LFAGATQMDEPAATPRLTTFGGVAQNLGQLIDEITVDCNGIDEELMGFLQVFLDEVERPISATVLGSSVEVTDFDFEGDERRGLVAVCRYRRGTGTVSLADVQFKSNTIAGWLHAAYRTWLGIPTFPARRPRHWAWPPL